MTDEMRTNSESRWLTEQLRTNRDFSNGWNSALWEVRKAQLDGYEIDGSFLANLVNHIDT